MSEPQVAQRRRRRKFGREESQIGPRNYTQFQVIPGRRPTEVGANFPNAVGVKSRSKQAQPTQRSTTVTVIDSLEPGTVREIFLPQIGLVLGLSGLAPIHESKRTWETAQIISVSVLVMPQAPRPVPNQVISPVKGPVPGIGSQVSSVVTAAPEDSPWDDDDPVPALCEEVDLVCWAADVEEWVV